MRSMASIASAISEAFLPFELLRCWCWRIAGDWIALFQPVRRVPEKSPEMRRALASPSLMVSSKIA